MHPLFQQLENTLGTAVAHLDATQTQLHPRSQPEKWNAQQVVEHLLMTYTSTCHAVEVRLAKGAPTSVIPSFKQRLLQVIVLKFGIFPSGRTAPAMVTPQLDSAPISGAQLTQSIHEQMLALDGLFNQVQAAYGDRPSITHKVLGPLRPNQWRRFHLLHARHHAKQITAIRHDHKL
jgi:hypothetical protein